MYVHIQCSCTINLIDLQNMLANVLFFHVHVDWFGYSNIVDRYTEYLHVVAVCLITFDLLDNTLRIIPCSYNIHV